MGARKLLAVRSACSGPSVPIQAVGVGERSSSAQTPERGMTGALCMRLAGHLASLAAGTGTSLSPASAHRFWVAV